MLACCSFKWSSLRGVSILKEVMLKHALVENFVFFAVLFHDFSFDPASCFVASQKDLGLSVILYMIQLLIRLLAPWLPHLYLIRMLSLGYYFCSR